MFRAELGKERRQIRVRIGTRLILGFAGVACLVGGVGYVGLSAANSLKEIAAISSASREVAVNIMGSRATMHNYIVTGDPDVLAKLNRERHEYEEKAFMWIEALGHGTDSAEFKTGEEGKVYKAWREGGYEAKGRSVTFDPKIAAIAEEIEELFKAFNEEEEKLREVHDRRIAEAAKFSQEYPREKGKRYTITEIVYKSNNPALLRDMGDVRYYSKEALYQHRDEKHIEGWLGSIKKLKADAAAILTITEYSAFSALCDEYYAIAETMGNLTLQMKQAEAGEFSKLAVVDEYIVDMDKERAEIEAAVIALEEETRAAVTTTLIRSIIAALVLAIGLGLFISRSIAAPISKLTSAVAQLGEGNLDVRVGVESKDEIGKLAFTFNKMAGDLGDAVEKEKKLAAATATADAERLRADELNKAYAELTDKTVRLERFQKITVGRELAMVELKKEVNDLLAKLNRPIRYETPEKIKLAKEKP